MKILGEHSLIVLCLFAIVGESQPTAAVSETASKHPLTTPACKLYSSMWHIQLDQKYVDILIGVNI